MILHTTQLQLTQIETDQQSHEISPTFPGELQYFEKSAGDPLVNFEQILEFNLLSILVVSKGWHESSLITH